MWHLYYNIHDLLSLEICGNNGLDRGKGLRYSFFETEKADNPDIILRIGKFTPSNQGCEVVGHKYHIKDNYDALMDRLNRVEDKLLTMEKKDAN